MQSYRTTKLLPILAVALAIASASSYPACAQGQGASTATGASAAGTPAAPGSSTGAGQATVGNNTSPGSSVSTTAPSVGQTSGPSSAGTNSNGGSVTGTTSNGISGNDANGAMSSGTSANGATTAGTAGSSTTSTGGSLPISNGLPAVLDLPTTIQLTINASNNLAVANRNIQKDQVAVDASKAPGRPQVSASASETYLDKPIKITFGQQTILAQPESTQDLHVMGSLPIDISGQIKNGVSISKLQVLADQFQRDQIYNSLVLKGETAYFNVLRAQHQVSVAQTAVQDADTQQLIATRQFDAGVGLKIDMIRANTQVAQAEKDLLQAQNMLALSRNNLNDATGRPLASAVSAVDVPGVTSGVAVAPTPVIAAQAPALGPAGPSTGQSASFTPPVDALSRIDIDKSIATALEVRPELEAGLVNIEAARRQIKLARRTMEPSLSFSLAEHYYPTTSFQTPDSTVGSIVAAITLPLYDGGLARDNVREAELTVDNAKSTYLSNKTDVELQVRQAYLNLQNTAQQIFAANTALDQAIAARQLAQVRYANGVGLYLEVTDAESALTMAETSQVNAVYDYLVARAQFENAVGLPNTNPVL